MFMAVASSVFAQTSLNSALVEQAPAIRSASQETSIGWQMIAEIADKFPGRLSGTPILEDCIDWLVTRARNDGFKVYTQPVMVPVWKRGEESLRMVAPLTQPLAFCSLGGSVSTSGVLEADVIVVESFDELERVAESVRGKIVVYNVPFTTYGQTVPYRYQGASKAAQHGAVASLVRSVGPFGLQTVHTGAMGYSPSVPQIPCGAISMETAMWMQRLQARGERITLALTMNCATLPDAPSRNVVVEIPGSEKPNEIVVVGGHIDAWDNGTGAMDDAGGCVVSYQALRIVQKLGLRPKRTLRCVFWTNEENGLRGGKAYAEQTQNDTHIMAIESDAGVFRPTGFTCSDTNAIAAKARTIATLLQTVGANNIEYGEGGADTSPLLERGIPTMELLVNDDRYFWYHHTDADTPDKLSPTEVQDCIYAITIMALGFAEL
jgi:carboxypeptidase Q